MVRCGINTNKKNIYFILTDTEQELKNAIKTSVVKDSLTIIEGIELISPPTTANGSSPMAYHSRLFSSILPSIRVADATTIIGLQKRTAPGTNNAYTVGGNFPAQHSSHIFDLGVSYQTQYMSVNLVKSRDSACFQNPCKVPYYIKPEEPTKPYKDKTYIAKWS